MKRVLVDTTLILVLVGMTACWAHFKWRECRQVGHSWLYCATQ